MGVLIDSDDFLTGRLLIAQGTEEETTLSAFIDMYEEPFLYELLGVTMYEAFKADLTDQVPTDANYLIIYNIFNKMINDSIITSKGMKEMLKSYIYSLYISKQPVVNTTVGNVINQNEVSVINDNSFDVAVYSNEAVMTYTAIQLYVSDNSLTYTDYEGIPKNFTSPL